MLFIDYIEEIYFDFHFTKFAPADIWVYQTLSKDGQTDFFVLVVLVR